MFFKQKQKQQLKEPITAIQACQIATNRQNEITQREIFDCLDKIEREAYDGKYYTDISLYCSHRATMEFLKSLGYEMKLDAFKSLIAYWTPKEKENDQ